MDFAEFLQLLNLPIMGGIVYLVFKAGYLVRKLEDHERRIGELEQGADWQRRQGDLGLRVR